MFKKISNVLLVVILFVGLSSFDSHSTFADKDWKRLGSKKVNFKIDKDVIYVGAKDGRFNKLKLVVSGGNINMHKMMVRYANGNTEEIQLRHKFSKLSSSRVIDLNGKNRFIKQIYFIYDTKNASKRRAKIHVFGK
ncbi:DUF2541 family protein [Spongiivirga citrea]|uniref:DUF2541 family protein n=1 Tax=Spongiivirga citrea TaxID=1481457 RepID=A0A6M0CRR5_9FLAO|nr:DUF2541 family protein [Spongiivirga citrea]NER16600.1 DUF2541 family protein [Spongiivirga citrea]